MSTSLSPLLAPMLSSAAMRAVCDDVACLQNMLDFEAALARAEAAVGVIPAERGGSDRDRLPRRIIRPRRPGRSRDAVRQSRDPPRQGVDRERRQSDADAARYVHWGATSQDVIDTGTMLGLRAGIDALLADTGRAIAGFAKLARQHRDTPVVARTWLQHALPMPFGLSSPNMPRRCIVRRSGCSGCATRRWHCNSAAPPARSPPSGPRDCRSQKDWRKNSSCRCRRRPGTPTATASRKPLPCSPSWPAHAARSPATFADDADRRRRSL